MQAPAAASEQQPASRTDPRKPAAPASSHAESPELDAIGKARIGLATNCAMRRIAVAKGEISIAEYLSVQKRYDEVVADVMVKTDADRIHFFERQLAGPSSSKIACGNSTAGAW